MFLESLLICSLVILLYMSFFYFLSITVKKTAVADVAWGLGFPLIAYTTLIFNGNASTRQLLVSILVTLWGVRLASYIFVRNRGKKEDFRYKELRDKWGKSWRLKSFIYVFLLQGVLMLLVSFPVIFNNTYIGGSHGFLDRTGFLLWVIGFIFESIGDQQMLQFKQKPTNKGKIMNTGLWRYTRHPNYFGETLMWWGIYMITLSNVYSWWTFVGPLFITFSLLKISGVTLLEKKYEGNKEYKEYQKKTSSFIPWFPLH